jgi:uncharacterized protein YciI
MQIFNGSDKFKQRETKKKIELEAKANEEANKVKDYDPYDTQTDEEKKREKELSDADPYRDEDNLNNRQR